MLSDSLVLYLLLGSTPVRTISHVFTKQNGASVLRKTFCSLQAPALKRFVFSSIPLTSDASAFVNRLTFIINVLMQSLPNLEMMFTSSTTTIAELTQLICINQIILLCMQDNSISTLSLHTANATSSQLIII